jgi:iron complex outermembrane receptor protein
LLSLLLLAAWAPSNAWARPADSVIVITRADLFGTGRTSLPEALQVLLPFFNLPRPSGAEWTDQLRPATLRGMGSDHLVVLVNGHRLPTSGFLNQHPTVGRGEVAADLEAIPLLAIDRVEVSRGIPSARYGSGAIAGVINLVLGSNLPREVRSSLGLVTSGGVNSLNGAAWGKHWGDGTRLELAGEYRVRGFTDHAEPDRRDQFFPGDPRNEDPRYRDQLHDRLGDPQTRRAALWLEASRPVRGAELYGSVGANRQFGKSAGLWRRPNEDATVRSLYPTGFLPMLESRGYQATVRLGARGTLGRWQWDLSAGYAASGFRMEVENTANASLGALSPTGFFAGALGNVSLTGHLEVRREMSLGRARVVRALAGLQARGEGYRLEPGERDSYRFGGVPIQDGPRAGGIAPVGAQGFPGIAPRDTGHYRQESYAGYAELAIEPLEQLSIGAAGRAELFPGTGWGLRSALSATGQWRPLRQVWLRGSAGMGYRAPGLAERRFSRSLIPVVNDVGLYDLLVPPSEPAAQSLGARPLVPEWSTGWGAGLDLSGAGVTFSADYSDGVLRRGVVLTEKFTGPGVRFFLESQGYDGIGAVQFLANAVKTRTRGVELRAGYATSLGTLALRLDAGFAHHRVEVTRVDSIGGFAAQYQSSFFGPAERARIESGQPRDNATGAATVSTPAWSGTVRVRRYGSVLAYGPSPDGTLSQRLGAKWLGDASLGFRLRLNLRIAAGVENLLGTLPDRLGLGAPDFAGNSCYGILPYSNFSPFGWNGRFAYARLEWRYAER